MTSAYFPRTSGQRRAQSSLSREERALRQMRADALAPLFSELKRQGRSSVWLARELGVDKSTIWAYAHGKSRMPNPYVTKTCELIGFPRERLEAESPILVLTPKQIIANRPKPKKAHSAKGGTAS